MQRYLFVLYISYNIFSVVISYRLNVFQFDALYNKNLLIPLYKKKYLIENNYLYETMFKEKY